MKIKENEKKNDLLDLVGELKKKKKTPKNMKVTMITTLNGVLGTMTKGLVKGVEDSEIRGRVETIQTTALVRSAKILRRVLET